MKLKKSIKSVLKVALSSLAVLALVLSSCTKDPLPSSDQQDKKYMDFSLELIPPGAFTPIETRALTEVEGNSITSAQVLIFKNDTLKYQMSGVVTTPSKGKPILKVILPTSQSEGDLFDIMVIANPPTFNFAGYEGKIKDVLKADLNVPLRGKWLGREFIMYGEVLQTLIKPTTNIFKIQMLRSLARVDIGVGTYNGSLGSWTGLNGVFSLTEVLVVNSRDKFAVIPKATMLNTSGNVKVSTPTIPTGTLVQGTTAVTAIKYSGTTEITNGTYTTSTIFLAEAPNNDANKVTLLIGGVYRGKSTYYRVDMCVPRADRTGYDYLNILRNHIYRVSITNITAAGFATPQLALASPSINITTTLTPIDDGSSGEILFDGASCIFTDVSDVLIYCTPDNKKSYNIATVKATFATGVSAAVSGPGITGSMTLLNDVPTPISYVIPPGTTNGSYTIKVGRLTKVIPFTVQPAVDAHFDFLPFANVASITVEEPKPWLTLSQNMKYVVGEQQPSQIMGDSHGKACLHFDENIAASGPPRTIRALVHRNNTTGTTTGVVLEQLNLSGMVLGYFGGTKDDYGYKKLLAIESVEELSEREYDDTSIRTETDAITWGFFKFLTKINDKECGQASTLALIKLSDDSGISGTSTIYNNSAARYCYQKNRGTGRNGEILDNDFLWYLPAQNQLIGAWLANNGVTKPLTNFLWSATEYYSYSSWVLNSVMGGQEFGYMYNDGKDTDYYGVRCVRDL